MFNGKQKGFVVKVGYIKQAFIRSIFKNRELSYKTETHTMYLLVGQLNQFNGTSVISNFYHRLHFGDENTFRV